MYKKIFAIVNPSSGKPEPILHTMNQVFGEADSNWVVGVTNEKNLDKLCEQMKAFDPDVIAIYGGDGTVSTVAQKVLHLNKPLAIIPGGTANVLSSDLNIPQNSEEACRLIVSEDVELRKIDAATANGQFFFTRIGWGLEAKMIEHTSDEMKDKVGNLAYAVAAFKALIKTQELHFTINIDGKSVKGSGLACIIANSGNVGVADISMHPVKIDDSLLDLFLFNESKVESLLSTAANIIGQSETEGIQHWQGRQIKVSCEPQEAVQCDGDILGSEDVTVEIQEQCVSFLVPKRQEG